MLIGVVPERGLHVLIGIRLHDELLELRARIAGNVLPTATHVNSPRSVTALTNAVNTGTFYFLSRQFLEIRMSPFSLPYDPGPECGARPDVRR